MKPPRCAYCKSVFRHDPSSGRLLRFSLSAEDKAFNRSMRDNKHVGHPRGAHWFCKDHYQVAQTCTHLSICQALDNIGETETNRTENMRNLDDAKKTDDFSQKIKHRARSFSVLSRYDAVCAPQGRLETDSDLNEDSPIDESNRKSCTGKSARRRKT